MSDSPDQIRADIERTRGELGMDVDALADKVAPSKIAQRQADKVRGAFTSVRERVMGAADDLGSSASGLGHSASGLAHSAGDAAHGMKKKAEGAPLAVGLIAFGAGLLLASLFPASRKEKEMAGQVKDAAQPLVDEVTDVAKEVAEDLKEPAQAAAAAVQERATEAASAVKDQATDAAGDVSQQAQQARDDLSGN